jgi:hypothetical protein
VSLHDFVMVLRGNLVVRFSGEPLVQEGAADLGVSAALAADAQAVSNIL